MAQTTSFSFPNLFDVSKGRVSIAEDNVSVGNRVRLMLLTDPTELYNEPTFGAGLRKHMWKYNTSNLRAMVQDEIKNQLRLFEPCVDPDGTVFADDLLFTGDDDKNDDHSQLKMTVGLKTIFGDNLEVGVDGNIK